MTLYEALKRDHPMVSIMGFADDTNLLAFGRTAEACTGQLERAWKTYLQWASTRGMVVVVVVVVFILRFAL